MNQKIDDVQLVQRMSEARNTLINEIGKIIIGQREVIDELLIALFSGGHVLLEGVPGLAKTLMIRGLSQALDLKFNRIQFTPDLMPSDIIGTEIIEENRDTGKKEFRFVFGPLFSQVILADEVNRTPPKTQSALLQAMQEHQISAAGTTYTLDEPFFVLATQNPIEQEGTYPLPEAQLDRFMFNLRVLYPSIEEELSIVSTTTTTHSEEINPVLNSEEIVMLQELVRRVPVAENVISFAVKLTRMSRPDENDSPLFIKDWIRWGAGPRAGQYLVLGAKARATLHGRPTPEIEDIKSLAHSVLRHRLVRTFRAEADSITTDDVIDKMIEQINP